MDEPIEEVALLADVATALRRLETVPADVVEQAKAAFAWREVANAVAALDYDSAVEDDALVSVRGSSLGSDRVLTFATDGGRVELYISDSGRRLLGKVAPNVFRSAVLRHPSRSLTLDVDASGTFFVDRLPRGPLSVKCVPLTDSISPLETEWVAI
ncbi:MAG TPA: hypothetical protein VNF07_07235 [Acidimicrobiales bacterium]|nr:hypothetical protein [Acidimicrobiales bacterium]